MNDLILWLDKERIDYRVIDNEVVDIPEFGRLFCADLTGVKSIFRQRGDEQVFNLMEDPQALIDEGIFLSLIHILNPIYREALLLQQAGYKLEEIMEIALRRGTLATRNIETVKSRLFLAKLKMRQMIDRDGNEMCIRDSRRGCQSVRG